MFWVLPKHFKSGFSKVNRDPFIKWIDDVPTVAGFGQIPIPRVEFGMEKGVVQCRHLVASTTNFEKDSKWVQLGCPVGSAIGSMVIGSMGHNLPINWVYLGYNPLILTIYQKFLGHPSSNILGHQSLGSVGYNPNISLTR